MIIFYKNRACKKKYKKKNKNKKKKTHKFLSIMYSWIFKSLNFDILQNKFNGIKKVLEFWYNTKWRMRQNFKKIIYSGPKKIWNLRTS